jgi:hypothetical protein
MTGSPDEGGWKNDAMACCDQGKNSDDASRDKETMKRILE